MITRLSSILWVLMLWTGVVFGQSSSTINFVSNIRSGANAVHTEQLWIGEHADITVDGDWEIYSDQIYIHPNAKIHGDGRIVLKNPNAAIFPFGENPTFIDGSQAKIDCDIVFENPNNIVLSPLSTENTDLQWNNDDHTKYGLYLGKNTTLAADDCHIILGDASVWLDDEATLSGYSENRYFVTNSDGALKKENLNGEFIFPVGFEEGTDESTDYTPAKLDNQGDPDGFSVSVDHSITDFPNSAEGINREWTIREDNEGGSMVELTLQHNENTEGSIYANDTSVFITQYIGQAPNDAGGSTSFTTWDFAHWACDEEFNEGTLTTGASIPNAKELKRDYLTDFYSHTKFTKATCDKSVLEDIWKIFTADVVQCETQISWVIAEKYTHPEYFVVERSFDGVAFLPATTIYATPGNEFYHYFDPIAPNGKVYYRIKVVDTDGDYEYSPVEMVESNCGIQVAAVYPNPFFEDITIVMNTIDAVDAVILYDEIGQRMDVPAVIDANTIKIDGTVLAAANYYVLVISGEKFFTVEVTKLLDQR